MAIRYILVIAIIYIPLFSEQIKIYRDGIIPVKVQGNKTYIRIYLNHEDSSKNEVMLSGMNPSFSIDIPVANRWKVTGARAVIKYTPSIALEEDRSFLNIKLKNYTLKQYPLLEHKFMDSGELEIKIDLPYQKLEQHNLFTIQLYQHYFKTKREDMTKAPEVWTQLNIEDSYIELEIEKKPIDKELSSLIGSVFDIFNPIEQNINYVFYDMSDETIYNYSFFSSILGKILQYRKVDFSITQKKIVDTRDNLIIATTKQLKEIFDYNGFGFRIRGNVNIFRNPKDKTLAIIIITARTEERLKEVLFSTFGLDLNLNSGNSKIVKKVIYPPPAPPYSTPGFVGSGKKIYFKDLGYSSRTFSGFFAPPLELEFKLYPDLFFQKKAKGKIFVNYIFPTAVQKESIANILINDKFVSQVSMLEERDTQNLKEYLFLDTRTPSEYPASLLRGGKNSLKIDMKMIPLSWNPKTLQATIMDDSYFEIPEARHWIGMADLQDFTLSAFPFSIYPDLQDTHILLTDKRVSTLEALMQIMRFLGENLKYPPYYLTIGENLDEVAKNKNLIVLGEYNEKWGEIYQNAPLVLTKHGYIRDIDLSNKFAETVEELEEENIDESEEDRKQFIRLFETTEKSEYLITQFFQSPFNSDKTILMFNGQDIDIKAEIKQVLDAKFRGKIKGDLVITKLTGKGSREIYNFDVKPPYYVGDFDTISRVYFLIGSNPLLFVGLSVFLIILIVYFLRKTLLLYRMRHHESDASAND